MTSRSLDLCIFFFSFLPEYGWYWGTVADVPEPKPRRNTENWGLMDPSWLGDFP